MASSAAHLVVQRWIDDAVEQLSSMMYTCSLDVARDYPDGLSESSVAFLLGVTEQAINQETKVALRKFKAGVPRLAPSRLGRPVLLRVHHCRTCAAFPPAQCIEGAIGDDRMDEHCQAVSDQVQYGA